MIKLSGFRPRFPHAAIAAALLAGAALGASANDVVALKNALYGAGYDISDVSPDMDQSTRNALSAFQRDQGIAVTGQLDEASKEALGMVAVQVAAAPQSQTVAVAASADEAEPETVEVEEDAIEEDEDGGWSFF